VTPSYIWTITMKHEHYQETCYTFVYFNDGYVGV